MFQKELLQSNISRSVPITNYSKLGQANGLLIAAVNFQILISEHNLEKFVF